MASNERDELDRILDTALAAYSASEPRPGLEWRVQNHIRASARRIWFPRWVLAIPAAACIIWAGYIWLHRSRPEPVNVVRQARLTAAPVVTRPKPQPPPRQPKLRRAPQR